MRIISRLFIVGALLASIQGLAQDGEFEFERKLERPQDQWHRIALPLDIFEHVSADFRDLRIRGVNERGDTLEAPYLVEIGQSIEEIKLVDFNMLNRSHNALGSFVTFDLKNPETINEITLDLRQANFDLKIKLEGSQDLTNWFTIVDDYRILSIQNEHVQYDYTDILFPRSNYKYYRLFIPDLLDTEFASVQIKDHSRTAGNAAKYELKSVRTAENKEDKLTEIFVTLPYKLPLSVLEISMQADFDYYRPIEIQALRDSTLTEKGWKYRYRTITQGVLSSIAKNNFDISGNPLVEQLRIRIHNHDNQALPLESVQISGNSHELVARFTDFVDYSLLYGNDQLRSPSYDIQHLTKTIPEDLNYLSVGKEIHHEKTALVPTSPLFENKIWLWAIMIFIAAILAWFSIKMLKN
jgi:hypothetical protein